MPKGQNFFTLRATFGAVATRQGGTLHDYLPAYGTAAASGRYPLTTSINSWGAFFGQTEMQRCDLRVNEAAI
jgi:hypothetical protein